MAGRERTHSPVFQTSKRLARMVSLAIIRDEVVAKWSFRLHRVTSTMQETVDHNNNTKAKRREARCLTIPKRKGA